MSLPHFNQTRSLRIVDVSCAYASVAPYDAKSPLIKGTVYFAHGNVAPENMALPEGTSMFILDNGEIEASDFAGSRGNVVLFTNPQLFESCFGELASKFEEERRLRAGIDGLGRSLARGEDLSDAANAIAALYHASVSIVDISFTQLAVSDNYATDIPEISDDLEQGRVSTRALASLRDASLLEPTVPTGKTRSFRAPISAETTLINYYTPILMNQMVMGSFSLITKAGPIPKPRLDLLPLIADLLSLAMRKAPESQSSKRLLYADLFTELVSSDAPRASEWDLNERFRLLGFELKRYKHVQFYDLSRSLVTEKEATVLASQLREHTPSPALSYVGSDFIILLLTGDKTTPLSTIGEQIVNSRRHANADDPSVRVGISDWFTEISRMRRHVDQARRAIELGRASSPDALVYSYETFRIRDLFEHLSRDAVMEDYIYPPLLGLLDYDQKNGTGLARTLYLYLRNLGHPGRTCEVLGIHRNTLYQRLDRIGIIMGTSWKEPEAVEQIRLGFEVLRYRRVFEP